MIGLNEWCICNEERIANTKHISNNIAGDIQDSLSEPGSAPCDNESLIIAGGCSGFENNTDLVTQTSLGIVTAALQMQGGDINVLNDNNTSASSSSDHSTINLPLGVLSTEQRPPVVNCY